MDELSTTPEAVAAIKSAVRSAKWTALRRLAEGAAGAAIESPDTTAGPTDEKRKSGPEGPGVVHRSGGACGLVIDDLNVSGSGQVIV